MFQLIQRNKVPWELKKFKIMESTDRNKRISAILITEISFPKLKKKKEKNETNNSFKKEENSNVSLVFINQVVKNSNNPLHSKVER